MIITSSPNAIDTGPSRPFANVPNRRQESFLNSAIIFLVLMPPMIYAASDVEAVEYPRIELNMVISFLKFEVWDLMEKYKMSFHTRGCLLSREKLSRRSGMCSDLLFSWGLISILIGRFFQFWSLKLLPFSLFNPYFWRR